MVMADYPLLHTQLVPGGTQRDLLTDPPVYIPNLTDNKRLYFKRCHSFFRKVYQASNIKLIEFKQPLHIYVVIISLV